LEVDKEPCGNTVRWHAITHVRCENGQWVELPNSSVGLGHPDPGIIIFPFTADFPVPVAAKLLTSDAVADRVKAYQSIRHAYVSGATTAVERQELIHDLLRIAHDRAGENDLASPVKYAIKLLGLLGVEEGIPVLVDNLLRDFQRPVPGPLPTPASYALLNIGVRAVPAIIQRASTAGSEEWRVLEGILRRMMDQETILRLVCAVLDSEPAPMAEERLDRYLRA
jgi:hypothetical protein